MAYKPSDACLEAASKAAKGVLSPADLDSAFQEAAAIKERLRASGSIDGMADRLRDAAEQQAEKTKIAAALARRHAALNVLVRDRLDQTLTAFKAAGLKPRQALLAVMEGSQQGVEGARNSVAALRLAYEARYVGGMLSEIQKAKPHLVNAIGDTRLSDDIMREMGELKEGGNPGLTKNADAIYLAKVFAAHAEVSRGDLNRLGASIGKLDGWAGAQVHDDMKLIAAGKDAWVEYTGAQLDYAKTFPDAGTADDVRNILGDSYDTIITGLPNRQSAAERGQRVNPANLAKSLGKSRVFHFKNADAAIAYRDKFGYGNTIYGIIAHQRRAAALASQMEVFGPNPEVMLNALIESERRKVRDSGMAPERKAKLLKGLDSDAPGLRGAFDVMSGVVNRPGNMTAAKVGQNIRAWQMWSKLGGAVLTAMPTDTASAAAASMFRGSGFWNGLFKQMGGMFLGRSTAEQKEIGYLFGEGFDGLIGDVVSHGLGNDGAMGKASWLTDKYFKWNGLTWWTDKSRAVVGRTVAAEMGMRAKTGWASLPPNYRHVLGLHGITEIHWEAIRQAGTREANGNTYITPDAVRALPDEVVEPLVAGRLAAAKTPERRAEILDEGRSQLELAMLRFVADETNYAIIEPDAASRRWATAGGTRPGTIAGEAARFIMQFKGFPVAYSQRVIGRALFGHAGATKGQRALAGLPHLGAIMAGMTVAGYMSMTMKDVMRGQWPPRDPFSPKTWIAAMTQGGALGIYGDFLFGQYNRFGSGPFETVAGPFVGTAADIVRIAAHARDGDPRAGEYLNTAINNTLFINMFYTRTALDAAFLNSLRDIVSPGSVQRQQTKRRKEYGQEPFIAVAH